MNLTVREHLWAEAADAAAVSAQCAADGRYEQAHRWGVAYITLRDSWREVAPTG